MKERIGFKTEDLRKIFTEEEYQNWLNSPNKHIVGNQSPNDLIKNRQKECVDDLAHCILTGSPI